MKYFIYNKLSGAIEKTILTNDKDLLEINYNKETHAYVEDDGTIFNHINVNTGEKEIIAVQLPEPPSPVILLEEEKQKRLLYIKQCRDFALISDSSTYTTTGLNDNITINARRIDLDNAKNLLDIMIAESLEKVSFICYDNSLRELTQEELKRVILELQVYGASLYQKKVELDAQINSATTIEEVLAVNW